MNPRFSLKSAWVATALLAGCGTSPDYKLVCDRDAFGLVSIKDVRTGEVMAQMDNPAVFKNGVAKGPAVYLDGGDDVENARMIVDAKSRICVVGMPHHIIKNYKADFKADFQP